MSITMSRAQIQERANEIATTEQAIIELMKEGQHFYFAGDRKILSKGGAEYLAKFFCWRVEMSDPVFINTSANSHDAAQQVYINAKVLDEKGAVIAYGGGGRNLSYDGFFLNTSLKMARKSAFVDAVLRASGLSGYFGQDVVEADDPVGSGENESVAANEVTQDAPKASNDQPADAETSKPTNVRKAPSKEEKKKQEQELAKVKKAAEELKQMAGHGIEDIPAMLGCDSLESMSLEQLEEAKELVASSQSFQAQQKSLNEELASLDTTDDDFILI